MNGKVHVWNADDWLQLRKEYRIVGALIGCLAHLPRQDSFLGLPMVLLPEEVTLLLEQEVARLVSYSSLTCAPSNDIRQKFQEYRKFLYKQQVCNINCIVKCRCIYSQPIITCRTCLAHRSVLRPHFSFPRNLLL